MNVASIKSQMTDVDLAEDISVSSSMKILQALPLCRIIPMCCRRSARLVEVARTVRLRRLGHRSAVECLVGNVLCSMRMQVRVIRTV